MTQIEEGASNPRGEALVQELLWVHNIVRGNLETVARLAEQVNAGASAEDIQAEIGELSRNSALWSLRVNCMRYCQLVHHHHGLEDTALFPGLRRANPALEPVIDKLEADHKVVSGQLDEVEEIAARLKHDFAARSELVAALGRLRDYLLTHLQYEEASISPTLRTLNGWPLI